MNASTETAQPLKPKILITGGAGLVGREVIRQLTQAGRSVRVLIHKQTITDIEPALVEQVACNILDVFGLAEAMEGIEEVYHCAAIVSFEPSRKYEMYKINVEGTANVVNTALEAGVRHLVHVSSVAALGRIRENEPITEQMQWTEETSNSFYGKSKYLGEMEVWRGMSEGLDASIVNPVIILGPGNWKNGSAQIFDSIYNGFPWYSSGVSGFVDVRDVAGAMIRLMELKLKGERYILSAGNYSYQDIFNQIADTFQIKRPHKKVTPLLAAIVWRLEALKSRITGKRPLVTKESAATALAQVRFDNHKLLQALPDFRYHSIQETISWTCNAYQKQQIFRNETE